MADTEAHLALLETEFEQLLDERAQKLPGEGTTEAEEALRDRFRESRFRQLLNALPAAVYTTDAAGRISFYNEAAAELWGCRPELGRSEWCGSWRLSWPDGTPLPHHECPMALALKEDRSIRGMEAVAERPDGTRVPFIPYPTPLHDASGKLVGAVNMLVDITDRKRAEEQQALLIRELHHRVRNMLATVQAIMAATARTSGTIQEFETDFTNRIAALARTQGSIADHDRQVISVENLLLSELARFEDGWGRIALNGPPIDVPPSVAVPLGMALHELTTNAAEHGSLSTPQGSLVVSWSVEQNSGERVLLIDWAERGGPEVGPPSRRGFGTQLLERVFTQQLGARVQPAHHPKGWRVRVAIPLAHCLQS
jgi:PAS domain S-box-containing protein